METCMINNIEYHYIDVGHGEPILLLHGFPDSSALWQQMIPGLIAAGYRVIAPDLRGYGATSMAGSAENYRMDQSAKDLFDLLNILGIKQVKVIGHDWGAFLGWYFTGHYPTVVTSYAAISVGHPKAYTGQIMRQLFKSSYIGLFLQEGLAERIICFNDWMLLKKMSSESELLKQQWLQEITREGRLTAGLNWYRGNINPKYGKPLLRDVPSIQVPVLGIIGRHDPALTVEQMKYSNRSVNSLFQFEIIEDGGHWLPVTHAAELNNVIIEFFKQSLQN